MNCSSCDRKINVRKTETDAILIASIVLEVNYG